MGNGKARVPVIAGVSTGNLAHFQTSSRCSKLENTSQPTFFGRGFHGADGRRRVRRTAT